MIVHIFVHRKQGVQTSLGVTHLCRLSILLVDLFFFGHVYCVTGAQGKTLEFSYYGTFFITFSSVNLNPKNSSLPIRMLLLWVGYYFLGGLRHSVAPRRATFTSVKINCRPHKCCLIFTVFPFLISNHRH